MQKDVEYDNEEEEEDDDADFFSADEADYLSIALTAPRREPPLHRQDLRRDEDALGVARFKENTQIYELLSSFTDHMYWRIRRQLKFYSKKRFYRVTISSCACENCTMLCSVLLLNL
jgi:hypothetical protein